MTTSCTGEALRAIRNAAGMTLQQVSDKAGVSPSYLSRVETGQVTPTANWVELVAVAMGEHMAQAQKDAA